MLGGERAFVLELSGEDAETVMHIVEEWVSNQRRKQGLTNANWLSPDRLREHRLREKEIQRVQKWVWAWDKLVREWGHSARSGEGISKNRPG